jgi:hypothetical protein
MDKIRVIMRMLLQVALVGSVLLTLIGCKTDMSKHEDLVNVVEKCDSASIQYEGGPSDWNLLDIKIGISSEDDLLAIHGEPTKIASWPSRNTESPLACIYYYTSADGQPAFWLAGGKVIGIEIQKYGNGYTLPDLPETQEDAKIMYGKPDIIGWSRYPGLRSCVWTNKGIQAELSVAGNQNIDKIVLFPPMSEKEFSESLWAGLVADINYSLFTDSVDNLPIDPFDWDND